MLRYFLSSSLALVVLAVASLSNSISGDEPPKVLSPKHLSEQDRKALPAKLQLLLPLHKPMRIPEPSDWLASHAEPGETYREFLAARPIQASKERRTIYIQPLGEFTVDQRKIVDLTAEFLGHFYQLPVKFVPDLPLSVIPAEGRRKHPKTGEPQILTTYVLHNLLKPELPKDAVVSLALTADDLWPGGDWNFVFGQASRRDRVGVWSIHRFGNASESEEAFKLVLLRTLKTAAHETGHMFSLPHCVHFECLMNGSNHLQETDLQPLWACPQCLAKLCHSTGAKPSEHFESLAAFAQEHGLSSEQGFWELSLFVLEGREE
jgi:archaemetzincin